MRLSDLSDREIRVGDYVVYAITQRRKAVLRLGLVTKMKGDRVFIHHAYMWAGEAHVYSTPSVTPRTGNVFVVDNPENVFPPEIYSKLEKFRLSKPGNRDNVN